MKLTLPTAFLFASLAACNQPAGHDENAYSQLHGESGISSGNNYDKIVSDLRAVAQGNAQLAEVVEYGKSGRGKGLVALKVYDKNVKPSGKRPAVLISEGIHGNEYLNITDRLPGEFFGASGAKFKDFVARGGVALIVPILNPDGYDARQRENSAGQDLNRDWTIKAAGNSGFTQPETKALSDFVAREAQALGFSLEVSMEYHCCIGGLIHPWAYTQQAMAADALQRHKDVGAKVQQLFGYKVGTVREIVGYDAVGGSDDYYFETYGRRAFSFEGAERTEQQNLAKHVELWNGLFDMALAGQPPVGPTPAPSPLPAPAPAITPAPAPAPGPVPPPAAPTTGPRPVENSPVVVPNPRGPKP